MNTSLNCITLYRYIYEGGSIENIMVIILEFGWMSEIIMSNVSYVKDIDFWHEKLRSSKIVIFAFDDVKYDYFWCAAKLNAKVIIYDYLNLKVMTINVEG